MATPITINVKNNSLTLQNFFFFQQPAIYLGGQLVYTNSLYTAAVLPYATSGSVLTFSLLLEFYAGVQQQVVPPQVGKPSGQASASQAIGLTPAPGGKQTNNTTNMSVEPALGLSVPVPTVGPQAGSFRIVTPTFNPVLMNYNAGSAVQNVSGGITLSNFVTAPPTSNLDCQPIIIFYVATGNYTPGTVMNFTASSIGAAVCDATPGYSTFDVSYNIDGTWTVKPFTLAQRLSNSQSAIEGALVNAEIKNEAGTGVISTGTTQNFDVPFTVNNLSNPAGLVQFNEYQVGPTGGPYKGRMCLNVVGNSATFGN